MTDLLLVIATMAAVIYAAYFISQNDGEGNTRPDKTLMAMVEDPKPKIRRWGRQSQPKTLPPRKPD